MLLLTLGACATPPKDPEALAAFKQTNDPIEPLNRAVFEFNLVIDKVLFRPIAFVYKEALPNLVQDFIRNFLNNLRSPVIFANDLLQGEFQRAEDTAWRALINSTFGIGGINDLAAELGILPHDEDFGQTLAVAGLDEGPYLMMPILGPTNPRDGVGLVVDIFFDPLTYLVSDLAFSLGRLGARGIDLRARAYDTIDRRTRAHLARLLCHCAKPAPAAAERRDSQ